MLAGAHLAAPWDEDVACTDASLTGFAILERRCHPLVVAALGRFKERWRFDLLADEDIPGCRGPGDPVVGWQPELGRPAVESPFRLAPTKHRPRVAV
eukprot:12777730-Alexandrium_andersonii.AAC.1